MKRFLLTLPVLAALIFTGAKNCNANTNEEFNKVIVCDTAVYYMSVEEMPSYPDGTGALVNDITKNISYSGDYKGRAIVQLKIGYDGVVREAVLVRPKDAVLEEAVNKACKSLKKFNPGKQNGNPVNALFAVPIAL
ncbi:MAG: energy transducer TonB [Bacteroidales bacterium]|nr:energy transducer TonB [Bacteroidales bacterium]